MNTKLHAYEILKARIESRFWKSGERLPPLRTLGEYCGVSRATMWKVVGLLKEQSLLHTMKGGAIFCGPAELHPGHSPTDTVLWERLKTSIGKEVLAGGFAAGRLPPTSKLALRYGTTDRTMKKALDGLVTEGLLTREGCRYGRAKSGPGLRRSTIVLITDSSSIVLEERTQEVTVCFERECVRLGHQYRLVIVDPRSTNSLIDFRDALGETGTIMGCIITLWNPWSDEVRRRWFDLATFLVNRKIPVITLDQSGDLPVPDRLSRSGGFRVLRIAGERAGEMVGDLLLRQGHRRCAFITGYFGTDWAQNRFNGLRRYMHRYGGAQVKVDLYTGPETPDINTLLLALSDFDRSDTRALFRERLSEDELMDLEKKIGMVTKGQWAKRVADPILTTVRALAHAMVELSNKKHDPGIFDTELEYLLHVTSDKFFEEHLLPVFERVLSDGNADVWVIPEQKSALAAAAFLRKKGRRVPDDIAVVGFDNWRANINQQLSTYDFNMNGMVRQALSMIVDEKSLERAPIVGEVDGYIVERSTTRNSRKSPNRIVLPATG